MNFMRANNEIIKNTINGVIISSTGKGGCWGGGGRFKILIIYTIFTICTIMEYIGNKMLIKRYLS